MQGGLSVVYRIPRGGSILLAYRRWVCVGSIPACSGSAWSGAVVAGIVAVIVNIILTYVIWMIIPPAQVTDMGYLLTMVGIMSFFAGLFAYSGGI